MVAAPAGLLATRKGIPALALVLVLLAPGTALAATVTFEISGEIETVTDSEDLLGGFVSVGMPFTGTLSYDLSIPDSAPPSYIGIYNVSPVGSQLSMSMSVAGETFSSNPQTSSATAEVEDSDANGDSLSIELAGGDSTLVLQGVVFGGIYFRLEGPKTVFDSDELPIDLAVEDFVVKDKTLAFSDFQNLATVVGDIQTITRISGPPPVTDLPVLGPWGTALLAAALLCAGRFARSR